MRWQAKIMDKMLWFTYASALADDRKQHEAKLVRIMAAWEAHEDGKRMIMRRQKKTEMNGNGQKDERDSEMAKWEIVKRSSEIQENYQKQMLIIIRSVCSILSAMMRIGFMDTHQFSCNDRVNTSWLVLCLYK